MAVNIEKARIMLWSALGLTGASVVMSVSVAWGVRDFIDKERSIQTDRWNAYSKDQGDIKAEIAAVKGTVDVQAEMLRSVRSEFGVRFDALSREQDRLRDEVRQLVKDQRNGDE